MSSKKINVDLILERSEAGATLAEVAKEAGCSPRTVSTVRQTYGFRSHVFLSPEQLALIEEKLDDGWSFAEIHRTLGHDTKVLASHFPGRGWSKEQAIEHRQTIRYGREGFRKAAA